MSGNERLILSEKIDIREQYWPWAVVIPNSVDEVYIIRCIGKDKAKDGRVVGHHPKVSYVQVWEDGRLGFNEDIQMATPHESIEVAKEHAKMLADCHRNCGSLIMEVLSVNMATGDLVVEW
jgi:hypothetical protein